MLQKLCLYCFHLKYIKKQLKKKKKDPVLIYECFTERPKHIALPSHLPITTFY